MIVKVCGMRDADNIRDVAALGIDLMGFIFWPESKRYVRMINSGAGILPDYSQERLQRSAATGDGTMVATAHKPKRVGVFVDDMPQNIVTRVYNYDLDYIQLHGSESRTTIENLRATIDPDIRPGIKFIKAIQVEKASDIQRYREYEGAVDMLLFDTKCKTMGGSGEKFDWSVLDAYDGNTPFLLSGGIGPDDAERLKAFHHPMMAGIDLNSRFEDAPALKNVDKLRTFLNQLRSDNE